MIGKGLSLGRKRFMKNFRKHLYSFFVFLLLPLFLFTQPLNWISKSAYPISSKSLIYDNGKKVGVIVRDKSDWDEIDENTHILWINKSVSISRREAKKISALRFVKALKIEGIQRDNIKYILRQTDNITNLDLSGCDIDARVFSRTKFLKNIKALNLRASRMHADALSSILLECKTVEKLNIGGSKINSAVLIKRISKLPYLKEFFVSSCDISISDVSQSLVNSINLEILSAANIGGGSISIPRCKKLTNLNLAYTEVSNISLANTIKEIKTLKGLYLDGLRIDERVASSISSNLSIVLLSLNDTEVDNTYLKKIINSLSLKHLSLNKTDFDNQTLIAVKDRLKTLTFLNIGKTKVSDKAFLEALDNLGNLVWLNIEETDINGESVFRTLEYIRRLEYINIKMSKVSVNEAGVMIGKYQSCYIEAF